LLEKKMSKSRENIGKRGELREEVTIGNQKREDDQRIESSMTARDGKGRVDRGKNLY